MRRAVNTILDVWTAEQNHELDHIAPGRSLYRRPAVKAATGQPWTAFKGLPRGGKGSKTMWTGMIWSAFRPSDDEQQYGYHIPGNMFAAVTLKMVARIAKDIFNDPEMSARASRMSAEVRAGIDAHGIVETRSGKKVMAYETDGLGNHCLMDDANVPSLLSSSYLGYRYTDPDVEANTRAFVLSTENPFYHTGTANGITYQGIGSPHTKHIPNDIWPMSLIMQVTLAQ